VFLAYASRHGNTLIDRRIYLPESWTSDPQRREQAAIPATITSATRSRLADDMITTALNAATPARWVTANEAYGNNTVLQARLRKLRPGYALAISRDHLVGIDGDKTPPPRRPPPRGPARLGLDPAKYRPRLQKTTPLPLGLAHRHRQRPGRP